MTPGKGVTRLVRVTLFSVTALSLGAAAHEVAGGTVSVRLAVFLLPVLMLLLNPLASRRRGLRVLLPAMAALQTGLHYIFMTASAAAGCHLHSTGPAHPSMAGADVVVRCGPAMSHGLHAAGPPMLAAHSLAAVVVVLLLARGDAVVWALAAAVRFRVLPISWTPPVLVSRRAVLAGPSLVVVLPAVFATAVRRRGPPAGACVTV